MVQDALEALLPLHTLRNIKRLELISLSKDGLPSCWAGLTHMTSLHVVLKSSWPWMMELPANVLAIRSLVELTLWLDTHRAT